MPNGDLKVRSSEGGGRVGGRLSGGNLKFERGGKVRYIEGPDMVYSFSCWRYEDQADIRARNTRVFQIDRVRARKGSCGEKF